MNFRASLLCLSLIFILLSYPSVWACTRVFWNADNQFKIVGRSMDLAVADNPLLTISPRGIKRNGDVPTHSINWVAKYGSVAIAEFHTNAVSDGMNEMGLAAHLLYLHQTTYEKRNNNIPGLANGLWVQYVLDNFKTVQEFIDKSTTFQIVPVPIAGNNWPLHLAIEDSTGDSAIVEFIDGKMKIYHGMQYHVMTNEPPYSTQLQILPRYKIFGGNLPLPGDMDPLSRFIRASSFLKTIPQSSDYQIAVGEVLAVLKTVMVPPGAIDTLNNSNELLWPTRWIAIGDLTHKVYYFGSTDSPKIMWIDLNNEKLSDGSPIKKN